MTAPSLRLTCLLVFLGAFACSAARADAQVEIEGESEGSMELLDAAKQEVLQTLLRDRALRDDPVSRAYVKLTMPTEERPRGHVRVTLGDEGGRTVMADGMLSDHEAVRRAAREGVERAIMQWPHRSAGALAVDGDRQGAVVRADGQEYGLTPIVLHLSEGSHRVSAELEGMAAEPVDVQVPAYSASPIPLDFDFVTADAEELDTPEPAPALESAPVQETGGGLAWLGPAALGAAGVAGVAVGVVPFLDEPCDVSDSSGRCLRGSERSDPVSISLLSAGGALIAGAAVWTILLLRDGDDAGEVVVGVGPAHLSVRGSF